MQKSFLVLLFLALTLPLSAIAADLPHFPPRPTLNKVTYQVTVEKWATTNTAKVTINMDAALDKVGLANVNRHVLETLHKMSGDADWHITQFNRSQDKSGLETLHVEAEARLPQNTLANLRDKAKSISKPGETYTIGDIDFTPALAEMEKTHADARAIIYEQVKQEIVRLNQLYPEQHYFLHKLDFNVPQIVPLAFSNTRMLSANNAMPAVAPPELNIPVNAKVTETAQVVVGAKISQPATP